ncbi:MAG: hypothetical protein AAF492_29835, partial [Verrucomicrobiota bacterium]
MLIEDKLPGHTTDRSITDVLPEDGYVSYPLPLPGDDSEDNVNRMINRILDKSLEEADTWRKALWKKSLDEKGLSLTVDYMASRVSRTEENEEENPEPEQDLKKMDLPTLFKGWMAPRKKGRLIVISALPGAGKTTLLTGFAEKLAKAPAKPVKSAHDLRPAGVIMTPLDIPAQFEESDLWMLCEKMVERLEPGCCRVDHPGLLKPYREAGKFHLLFDGLDEFGSRRPEKDLSALLKGIKNILEQGVHVVLTCRKLFWQLKGFRDREKDIFYICRFTRDEASEYLRKKGVSLPRIAGRRGEGLEPWVLNPLMFRFLLALKDTTLGEETLGLRSHLYRRWAEYVTDKGDRDCGLKNGGLMEFFS